MFEPLQAHPNQWPRLLSYKSIFFFFLNVHSALYGSWPNSANQRIGTPQCSWTCYVTVPIQLLFHTPRNRCKKQSQGTFKWSWSCYYRWNHVLASSQNNTNIFESSNTHLCSHFITIIVSRVLKESYCKSKEPNLTSYTLKNKGEKHQKLTWRATGLWIVTVPKWLRVRGTILVRMKRAQVAVQDELFVCEKQSTFETGGGEHHKY